MRLIVTRPQREAQQWVHDLSVQGLEAVALPLISIGPVDNSAALGSAWQQVGDYVAVMFVSANAVDYFFESNKPLGQHRCAWPAIKTRAWATGPGTSRALLRAGVAPEGLDAPSPDAAQFDSEALWARVSAQVTPGARVLIVRGQDCAGAGSAGSDSGSGSGLGRDWLAEHIKQAGGLVDQVVAYQRRAPEFSPFEQALAQQAAADGSVWLFSSSEALANLLANMAGQSFAGACALATHPRIAQAAKEAGFGQVLGTRPTLADVAAALQRLVSAPQHFKIKP
jgi:uroporphyrinogen-III synthase